MSSIPLILLRLNWSLVSWSQPPQEKPLGPEGSAKNAINQTSRSVKIQRWRLEPESFPGHDFSLIISKESDSSAVLFSYRPFSSDVPWTSAAGSNPSLTTRFEASGVSAMTNKKSTSPPGFRLQPSFALKQHWDRTFGQTRLFMSVVAFAANTVSIRKYQVVYIQTRFTAADTTGYPGALSFSWNVNICGFFFVLYMKDIKKNIY